MSNYLNKQNIVLNLIFFALCFANSVSSMRSPENVRNYFNSPVENLIAMDGYPIEVHYLTTSDGYILQIYRIPQMRMPKPVKKPRVALLLHSLLSNSFVWIATGAKRGLAYVLAEAGYDVWMINFRFTVNSQRHIKHSPSSNEYWQFSVHELAIYDLAETMDFVKKMTNSTALYMASHSLGGTIFYALMAHMPKYNKYVAAMVSTSTPVYIGNMASYMAAAALRFPILLRIVYLCPFSEKLGLFYGLHYVGGFILGLRPVYFVVGLLHFLWRNTAPDIVPPDLLPMGLYHNYQPFSHRMIHQLSTMYRTNTFCQDDMGPLENLRRYNSTVPPVYDLKKVVCPSGIFYGSKDIITTPSDIQDTCKSLPGLKVCFEIPEKFNHMDFVFSDSSKEAYADRVLGFYNTFKVKK